MLDQLRAQHFEELPDFSRVTVVDGLLSFIVNEIYFIYMKI